MPDRKILDDLDQEFFDILKSGDDTILRTVEPMALRRLLELQFDIANQVRLAYVATRFKYVSTQPEPMGAEAFIPANE